MEFYCSIKNSGSILEYREIKKVIKYIETENKKGLLQCKKKSGKITAAIHRKYRGSTVIENLLFNLIYSENIKRTIQYVYELWKLRDKRKEQD